MKKIILLLNSVLLMTQISSSQNFRDPNAQSEEQRIKLQEELRTIRLHEDEIARRLFGRSDSAPPSDGGYGSFSQERNQNLQPVSVRQNYPNLVNYNVDSLDLEEGMNLSVFLDILEGFESFKINWILDENVKNLYTARMPRLKFNNMHVGDILDALNSFALSSPNYNILFRSNINTISIESLSGTENRDRKPLQSYPMSELYKKYSMAEILTLVEAALQFDGETTFKDSAYKPRYHEESQILMLNLSTEESRAINDLFNSLRQNSTSREYTPEYKKQVLSKFLTQKDLAENKMNELDHQLMRLIDEREHVSQEIEKNPESENINALKRISENIKLREKYLNDQIHKSMSIISKIEEQILMIQAFGKI